MEGSDKTDDFHKPEQNIMLGSSSTLLVERQTPLLFRKSPQLNSSLLTLSDKQFESLHLKFSLFDTSFAKQESNSSITLPNATDDSVF